MKTNNKFETIWEREVKEINSKATLFRYKKNGAEILSIENEDENKVFGITFRTPPSNSTGVAHILEHSVLCGSRKYPLKEPFVELLKGSLQTFLNALTFPDKTSYPVASQNEQDFYNLIDVYLDAVFHPLLSEETFLQEGWHLEIEKDQESPRIVGVVYNEMKGAYSSPDSLLLEYSQQSLFPDTTYGVDSGGHPEKIPELSYKEFIEFHKKFYHPSNTKIFFWGNDETKLRLEILDKYLSGFDHKKVDSHIPLQKRFSSPRKVEIPYPPQGKNPRGYFITLNWLMEETSLIYVNFALQILEYLLVNMDSSILKRALIESGLGEKLTGVGLEEDIRQMYFSTGLKGVEKQNLEKVEALIFSTLEDVYKNGFDPSLVEAALNSFEFDLRENNSGSLPRGLVSMFRSLTTWLYDEDPLLPLAFEKPLGLIKSNLKQGERIFEELVAKYMLNNPHHSVVILKPQEDLRDRMEERERNRARQLLEKISKQEVSKKLIALKKYQQKIDRPEDLEKLPHLKRQDLPEREVEIPCESLPLDRGEILLHDLFTNNILYIDIAFDISRVPQRHLPYVNLLGRLLVEMGTQRLDYSALDRKIQTHTGGIHHELFVSTPIGTSDPIARLLLRAKVMGPKMDHLFEILKEILLEVNLSNKDRFKQILLQEKARLETSLIPAGHLMVSTRLKSKLSSSAWIEEQIAGINYLLFLRYLVGEVDRDWDGILYKLERTREMLCTSSPIVFNLTGDKALLPKAKESCKNLLRSLSPKNNPQHRPLYQIEIGNEAIYIPAQVNFVAKGISLKKNGYEFKGSHLVVMRYLRNTWLWNKIRAEGGAYGAFGSLDRFSRCLSFVSYRDPCVYETIHNFDACGEFLKNLNLEEREIEKAIVGCIGDIDKYRLPDAKGLLSLMRHLIGDTRENREKMRQEILTTTKEDFIKFAQYLDDIKEGEIVVLGSEEKISQAEDKGVVFKNKWAVM